MNIIIDLELNQVVQSWGNRNPTSPILVKSQDTPAMGIYFGRGQVNYDLGPSPGIRFALYVTGSPNALVDQTGFIRKVDSQNKTAYVAYPNFNTIQMQAAMSGLASIQAVGEVRYQTPFGTIARTLDIPFTINRSLLQETTYDTTIAAFTVPTVNANVTVSIHNTGWLAPNQNITIGNGGGAYQVVSVTSTTDFVAKNLGGTGNAAAGSTIPFATSVGNTPTSALGVYPDPSTIELLVHKNQPNGYAGLTAGSKLSTSAIPVDGQTVVLDTNGNLAVAYILTYLSASFTTVASGATAGVTVVSTAKLTVGTYVRLQGAGFYRVASIADATHATITNNGDAANAAAGIVIPSATALVLTQAGGVGSQGENAFTSTSANFTVPAVGANVNVSVGATDWMGGIGFYIFIRTAGYYQVASVIDGVTVSATNLGGSVNAAPATVINSGSTVTSAGQPGAPGPGGGDMTKAIYDTNNDGVVDVAKALTTDASPGALATVWGRDASGKQNLFTAPSGGGGSGDMTKAVYDTNNDGVVDHVPWSGINGTPSTFPPDATAELVARKGVANGYASLDATGKVPAAQLPSSSVPPQESLGAHIESPTAKTYTIDLAASSAYTIKAFKCILGAGTLTLALVQNGSNVSGAGAISVSSSLSTTTLTQAVALNDKIQITLSAISSATDLQFTMWIQR